MPAELDFFGGDWRLRRFQLTELLVNLAIGLANGVWSCPLAFPAFRLDAVESEMSSVGCIALRVC